MGRVRDASHSSSAVVEAEVGNAMREVEEEEARRAMLGDASEREEDEVGMAEELEEEESVGVVVVVVVVEVVEVVVVVVVVVVEAGVAGVREVDGREERMRDPSARGVRAEESGVSGMVDGEETESTRRRRGGGRDSVESRMEGEGERGIPRWREERVEETEGVHAMSRRA